MPGSAVLWVYSTLLMQQRVPNELLGRLSSLESALYTVSESASSVFGGEPAAAGRGCGGRTANAVAPRRALPMLA